jgi:7-cyano-7-deazaguanine synthase in queuosine biosynthesis
MATVACSGGLDSTVLLYMLAEQACLTQAVLVNFGQPSFSAQSACVKHHIEHLHRTGKAKDVRLEVFDCCFPTEYLEGRPFEASAPRRPARDWPDALSRLFGSNDGAFCTDNFAMVPARNTLITLYAAIAASHYEQPPEINLGFQFEPEQWDRMDRIAGDLTPRYWAAVDLLLQMALDVPVSLELPFIDRRWSKARILEEARRLGVDVDKTYSCEFGPNECGACVQCLLKLETRRNTVTWLSEKRPCAK